MQSAVSLPHRMRLKCFEAIRGNLGFEVRSFIAAIVFPMTKMLPEVRAAHSSANTHQPGMRGKKAALSTNLESQPELPTRMLVLLNREGEVFLLSASLYGRKEAIYCIHCPPQPYPPRHSLRRTRHHRQSLRAASRLPVMQRTTRHPRRSRIRKAVQYCPRSHQLNPRSRQWRRRSTCVSYFLTGVLLGLFWILSRASRRVVYRR